jgi:hypothetical protein
MLKQWYWGGAPNHDLLCVITDVIAQVGGRSAEKAGEQVGTEFSQFFLSAAASAAVGAVAGVGCEVLIRALLMGAEQFLKGPDKNQQMIGLLTSEPFVTGTREILHALSLKASSSSSDAFRDNNLRAGVQKLQSALTFAENKNDRDQEIFILFLIGISESLLPGGLESSAVRFESMMTILSAQAQERDIDICELDRLHPAYGEYAALAAERQEKVNRFVRKHWYAFLVPQVAMGGLVVKAGIKGKEIVDMSVAKNYLKKRKLLVRKKNEVANLRNIVLTTINAINGPKLISTS